jgi:hypothetical protein
MISTTRTKSAASCRVEDLAARAVDLFRAFFFEELIVRLLAAGP